MQSPSPFRHRSNKGNLHCDLCRVMICKKGDDDMELLCTKHEAGPRHLRNLKRQGNESAENMQQEKYCRTCDVRLVRWEQFLPQGYSPYGNKVFARECQMTLKDIAKHTNGRKHQASQTRRESACQVENEMRIREAALAACTFNGLPAELGQAIVRLVLEEA